jgi:hypothetical protein
MRSCCPAQRIKKHMELKSAQKNVHQCTVFCAQVGWFTALNDHSVRLNIKQTLIFRSAIRWKDLTE